MNIIRQGEQDLYCLCEYLNRRSTRIIPPSNRKSPPVDIQSSYSEAPSYFTRVPSINSFSISSPIAEKNESRSPLLPHLIASIRCLFGEPEHSKLPLIFIFRSNNSK